MKDEGIPILKIDLERKGHSLCPKCIRFGQQALNSPTAHKYKNVYNYVEYCRDCFSSCVLCENARYLLKRKNGRFRLNNQVNQDPQEIVLEIAWIACL